MFNIKEVMHGLFTQFRESNSKVSESDFTRIWSEVESKVNNEPPPRIAVLGNTGVGKSSTLNALFNAGQSISHTEACTQIEGMIEITANTVEGEKGILVVYDMPGLDESINSQQRHLETYERVLKDVDVAIWVLEAHNRGMKSVQDTLTTDIRRINPKLLNRIVFALNKVDLVHPGTEAWHPLANLPSDEQEENIKKRIGDVSNKILEILPEWKGEIVGYSAEKRYNLPKLFSVMLDAVPLERRWVITSRKALSDFLELVDERLLPEGVTVKKSVKKEEQSADIVAILKSLSPEELKNLVDNNKGDFENLLKFLNQQ